MVNLVVMRHGEAVAYNNQDIERQLTPRGEAEVALMAAWLGRVYPPFDKILVSPYVRTRQTAAIVQQALGYPIDLDVVADLVPDGDAQQVHSYVEALSDEKPMRLLLVSHMPLVSFLVEAFTSAGNTPVFETAAVACIHYERDKAGLLLEKMSPLDIELLSKSSV